jgi:hypothetical protein
MLAHAFLAVTAAIAALTSGGTFGEPAWLLQRRTAACTSMPSTSITNTLNTG